MAFHFIAIASDYTSGIRIGWHYSDEKRLNTNKIQSFMKTVKQKCGDIPLAIHKLSTESTEWQSVVDKDSFFEDVVITPDMDKFIELVTADRKLSAYDVAKFILSIYPTSHLKLQKLLYFAYAEFLIKTGKKLFDDPIVAYKYGPVVESVFQKFKVHGSSIIDFMEDEESNIKIVDIAITPTFMKVASSEQGIKAMSCILDVIKKYSSYSAFELVQLTHKKGGPWDRVYRPGQNRIIKDELIYRYHSS